MRGRFDTPCFYSGDIHDLVASGRPEGFMTAVEGA